TQRTGDGWPHPSIRLVSEHGYDSWKQNAGGNETSDPYKFCSPPIQKDNGKSPQQGSHTGKRQQGAVSRRYRTQAELREHQRQSKKNRGAQGPQDCSFDQIAFSRRPVILSATALFDGDGTAGSTDSL